MQKKFNLTSSEIEKLPFADKGKQVDYYDSNLDGFGVRVSHTGKKFFVRANIGNRRIRVMMKSTQLISAEAARKEAKVKLGTMAGGIDPNAVEREKNRLVEEKRREVKQQGITLQKALDEYLADRKLKPRTVSNYKDLLRLYLSDWLTLPANEITRDMVKDRHRAIADGKKSAEDSTRREAAADNCMRTLRAVLNYTFADEDESYANPVRTLSRKKTWFKVERRRSLIKNSDLPAWHKAVMGVDNLIARDFLLFLLYTGLRREEAATLQWKQVDFDDACFTLIGGMSGVTKNKEPLTLPLSDFLYKLLKDRQEGLKPELEAAKAELADASRIGETLTLRQRQALSNRVALAESRLASPYVFPGEGAAGYIVNSKRVISSITSLTGITFSPHDLRRTFATIAESLDLSGYTVKALLNHKQQIGDVTGGYIQINVDRLREPMQKITNAIQKRIEVQHGQVIQITGKESSNEN